MALRDFGKAENDPGEWVDFGITKPFRLRIRRIPPDVWDEIDRRYRAKESFEIRDGIRRRVPDQDSVIEALRDKAIFAWTDAEGLTIDILHSDASKLWGDLLKATPAPEVGSSVDLAGSALTVPVKRRVLDHLRPIAEVEARDDETGTTKITRRDIASFIVLEAARIQQEFAERKAAEQSNS